MMTMMTMKDTVSRGPSAVLHMRHLYILNAVRCPYVRSSVTLGVASSAANDDNENDVTMRTGAPSAVRDRHRRETS